jgi:hypothetical protein
MTGEGVGYGREPARPLAWVLAIVGVLVLVIRVAVAYGLAQPDNTQPSGALAIEVLDHGSRVRIAVAHCPAVDVTGVSISSFPLKHGIVQDQETQLWKMRPVKRGQWLFDTGTATASFAGLAATDKVAYYADVDYDQSTAPAKYKRGSNLSLEIRLQPSSQQQAAFDAISRMSC